MFRRRTFVKSLLAAGALGARPADVVPPQTSVKRVLIVFKCHLDVGFTDTQANVLRSHFERHFPQAIETAVGLRRAGGDRYVWSTGSWLLYEYLEQASREDRRRMEKAVQDGDIAWHGLPFSWQTELMDPSLIEGALGFAQSLDRRFGRTTTGAKMTDVPGHTRGIIAPLAAHGIRLLDIGVNSASTPPDVPPLFVWEDPEGRSLTVMYHLHAYGGLVQVPGSDLAIDVEVRGDNRGPHTVDEIQKIYAGLRERFPAASMQASSLTEIANAVEPHRSRLPVFSGEIGDTWIYGAPSDPIKVARYREVARLRNEWIANGKLHTSDSTDIAFLRRFLLAAEHTWGTDTKRWLDFDRYTPRDLARMLDQPKYKVVQSSWAEKRNNLFEAIATLPAPLRAEATGRVRSLDPVEPRTAGWEPFHAGDAIETKHFAVALDPRTGAICRLHSKKTGRDWATAQLPLALFSYQTLSKEDYDRFFAAYLKSHAEWAAKDFGKPGIETFGAESRTWQPTLAGAWQTRNAQGSSLVAQLRVNDPGSEAAGRVAWPRKMYLELSLSDSEPVLDIIFSWFEKAPNRMPEALWLSFLAASTDPRGWLLEKTGGVISPFEVVSGGNRNMHAVSRSLRYRDSRGKLTIETLDAPVVSVGERSPVYFSNNQPDPAHGFHFSLFNNGWGTNYVQWFGEDMRFRFRISE